MFKFGDKVTYLTSHKLERGIVKYDQEKGKDSIFVVYYCGDDWKNFQKYTSARTNLVDLIAGWTLPDINEKNYEIN